MCAWGTPVATLLTALAAAFSEPRDTFLWVDFLHLAASHHADELGTVTRGLRVALTAAERHVLVVDRAQSALQDSWCLLQLHLSLAVSRRAVEALHLRPGCDLPPRLQHSVGHSGSIMSVEVCLVPPSRFRRPLPHGRSNCWRVCCWWWRRYVQLRGCVT